MDDDDFEGWLQQGISKGWVSAPFCATHDGAPLTPEELDRGEADDDYFDGCVPCVRLAE